MSSLLKISVYASEQEYVVNTEWGFLLYSVWVQGKKVALEGKQANLFILGWYGVWVLDMVGACIDKTWSNCLESPTLSRHHDWRGFFFHQVGVTDFLWLSFPAIYLHLAVLCWSYVRGSLCWQCLLAAGGTVFRWSSWGGTRVWTSGARGGRARLD